MKNLNTKSIVRQGLIAAIYFVLTVTLGGFAYGPVQFRYAEVLNLLAFYNPINAIGVTMGVFLSNLGSPLGLYDVFFGTLHTAIALYCITKSTKLIVASLFPTLFAFIIGYELSYLAGFGSIWEMTLSVMISEFIIMTLVAVPLFKMLEKNHSFMETIGACQYSKNKRWY